MNRLSLRARLLLVPGVVVSVFLVLAGVSLQEAFRASVERSMDEQLRLQVNALLGAAEVDPHQVSVAIDFLDERFASPDSGLYGFVRVEDGLAWQSPSAIGLDVEEELPRLMSPGAYEFTRMTITETDFVSLGYRAIWVAADESETRVDFYVLASEGPFRSEIISFSNTLWAWLAGLGLALLTGLFLIVVVALRPLSRILKELREVEHGDREKLGGGYPLELERLRGGLNELLAYERSLRQRYRDTLDDLAHSLKTPLQVLRTITDRLDTAEERDLARQQIERMDASVAHQMRRAVFKGPMGLRTRTPIEPVIRRVTSALSRVYDVTFHLEPALAGVSLNADEGDLMEVVGNVVENSCKYGATRVCATVIAGSDDGVSVVIDDDGPGIPQDDRAQVLARGSRLDTAVPGQGIGLSVVADIMAAYGGGVVLDRSTPGGTRVTLQFPA